MSDLLQKLELLHATGTLFIPANGDHIVKTLYEILNVLDGKSLALLAFDGILVAATTFTAEKGDVFNKRGLPRLLAILIIVFALGAAALCLCVAQISYPFFDYVKMAPGKLDFSEDIRNLSVTIDWRTWYYRVAWWFSIIAIPLYIVMFWVSLDWSKQKITRKKKS
jgi:hypothetical protein